MAKATLETLPGPWGINRVARGPTLLRSWLLLLFSCFRRICADINIQHVLAFLVDSAIRLIWRRQYGVLDRPNEARKCHLRSEKCHCIVESRVLHCDRGTQHRLINWRRGVNNVPRLSRRSRYALYALQEVPDASR